MKRLLIILVVMLSMLMGIGMAVHAESEVSIDANKTAQWQNNTDGPYTGRIHGWSTWETAVYIGFTLPNDFTADQLKDASIVLATISAGNSGTGYIYAADYDAFEDKKSDYAGTDNAPAYTSTEIGTYTTPTTSGEFGIDITNYIASLSAGGQNVAFRLDVKSQNTNNNWLIGTTMNETAAPKLVLTYDDGTERVYNYTFHMDGEDEGITYSGNTSFVTGQKENAVQLDGGYAILKKFPFADSFTFTAWVKTDEIGRWARIFDFGADTNNYIFFTLLDGDGTSRAVVKSNGGAEQIVTFENKFAAGVWNHVALTLDGDTDTMTAYINGEAVGSGTITVPMSDLANSKNNYLGKSQWPSDPLFYGVIDEVEIKDSVLTAAEIKEKMNSTAATLLAPDDLTIKAEAGVKPNLPPAITVKFDNDMTATANVTWESYNAFEEDGTYTVNGTVTAAGQTQSITANITVTSDSILSGYSVQQSIDYANNTGACFVSADYNIYTKSTDKLLGIIVRYNSDGSLRDISTNEIEPINGITRGSVRMDLDRTEVDAEGVKVRAMLWKLENGYMQPVTATEERTIKNITQNSASGGFADTADIVLTGFSEDDTDATLFGTSAQVGMEYIKGVEVDKLLAPSYEVHGLTAPNNATRYGGWERLSANNWAGARYQESFTLAGHSLGHWMSAAAVFYAETRDEEVLADLNYAVQKLDELQRETASPYIGGCLEDTFTKMFAHDTSWADGYWVPWYGIHKIYQGLIDAYYYTGNQTALEVVKKFTDWAVDGISGLDDSFIQSTLNVEYGGMNEVFAEMYEITGKEEYLTAARKFTHDTILNPLISNNDWLTGNHANTQIPKIIGAAEVYEQDTEKYADYKTACENFWNIVVNNRSYVIGGNSIGEHFEAQGAESLGVKTCESCNTYNMMKLTEHLFSWNHDSKYMDWYENALYNHILGHQDPDTGSKMYFVSLLQGHHRIYEDKYNSWWCCTGTGMENPGRYTRAVYYTDGDELYINLYIPTEYTWQEKGLTFKMETNYPYSDKVIFRVTGGSGQADIKLRTPSWVTSAMTAVINGDNANAVTKSEGGYMSINREWKENDVIEVTIPMSVRTYQSRIDSQVAFQYGPVVLASELGSLKTDDETYVSGVSEYVMNETTLDVVTQPVPYIITDGLEPDTLVDTVDASKLTFRIDKAHSSDGHDIELKPFYEIHHHFHNVYWDKDKDSGAYYKALNAVTVDVVQPDGQQDELGHGLNSSGSSQGSFTSGTDTYYWRDAKGNGAYFQYTMNVNADTKYLFVRYWGADTGRTFDIYVDDVLLQRQTLDGTTGEKPLDVLYDISDKVSGKETITVKFAAIDSTTIVGGMLEMRTTTDTVTAE